MSRAFQFADAGLYMIVLDKHTINGSKVFCGNFTPFLFKEHYSSSKTDVKN